MWNILQAFDLFLLMKINSSFTGEWADYFFPMITDLHKSPKFLMIVPPLTLWLFWRKHAKTGLVLFLFMLITIGANDFLANQTTKKVFQRARPAANSSVDFPVQVRSPGQGYSFVSNHTANMFCFALFFSYFIGYSSIIYLIAFLVGYSRIYNGVHFPSDVLGGALFGTFFALIIVTTIKKHYLRGQK
jgi:undecaprenyl-diphosphatase